MYSRQRRYAWGQAKAVVLLVLTLGLVLGTLPGAAFALPAEDPAPSSTSTASTTVPSANSKAAEETPATTTATTQATESPSTGTATATPSTSLRFPRVD